MTAASTELSTEQLILRRWREADREPFARMNQDPLVMKHFPSLLSREESDALVDRICNHFRRHGFGWWVAELRESGAFIGFIGLSVPRFEAAFTPCVEIGWRLAREFWRKGLAIEGARAVARCAFDELCLPGIVSFTVPANVASRRVMEKLGMTHDVHDDFDHPLLPEAHPMRRHVLYRLQRANWRG